MRVAERDDRAGRGILGAAQHELGLLVEHRHVGERVEHLLGIREPARRLLRERALHDVVDRAREVAPQRAERPRRPAQREVHRLLGIAAGERMHARQHLVQDHADRVEVGTR